MKTFHAKAVLVSAGLTAGSLLPAAPTFIGADGSGTGFLDNPAHWSPAGVPAADAGVVFNRSGTVGAGADVTVGTVMFDAADADVKLSLGGRTLTANGGLNMAVSDTSVDSTLEITDGTLEIGKHFYTSMAGSRSTVRVGDGGILRVPAHTVRLCGYARSSSNTLYVGKNASLVANTLLVGDEGPWGHAEIAGATNVAFTTGITVGKATGCHDCSLVISNASHLSLGDVTVGNLGSGARLLITNVTDVACSRIYVGSGATNASGEVYLPANCTPTLYVGSDASATGCRLVYDAGGAAVTGTSVFAYFVHKAADTKIDFRHLDFTCTDVMRYRPTVDGIDFVIGKGSRVTSTFASYTPFFLEGVPGTRVAIDGGTMDLTDAASEVCFQITPGDVGSGNLFEVVNGGVFDGTGRDVYIGDEDSGGRVQSGGNTIRVAGDAQMTFRGLRLWNSGQTFVISNATLTASSMNIPYGDNPGWATNNVVRFEGTSPRLVTGYFNVYSSVDDVTGVPRSETVLEFDVPAAGYASVPFTAEQCNFGGKTRLRVDPSAYRGPREWMTLVKCTSEKGTIDFTAGNSWTDFVSGLPANCEARLVDSRRELQLRITTRFGTRVIIR